MVRGELDDDLYPEMVLNAPPETDAVKRYAEELVDIEQELVSLEACATQIKLSLTGINTTREIRRLENRHRTLVNRLYAARRAALRETPDPVEAIETDSEQEFERRARSGEFDNHLDRLERLAERTGQRLASRRNSANARIGLIISVVALLISVVALFTPT